MVATGFVETLFFSSLSPLFTSNEFSFCLIGVVLVNAMVRLGLFMTVLGNVLGTIEVTIFESGRTFVIPS